MKIPKQYQLLAQELLNESLIFSDKEPIQADGFFGPISTRAAQSITGLNHDARRFVALLIQEENNNIFKEDPILEDAWWGPDTAWAAERLWTRSRKLELPTRPDERDASQVEDPEKPERRPVEGLCDLPTCYSPSTREMLREYGPVGTNQVTYVTPYALKLDWDLSTSVSRITTHQKIREKTLLAMENTQRHYGKHEIERLGLNRFGGALNVRRKRGGSTWSFHAWGAAIDWFPEANALRETAETARFAQEDYKEFVRIWQCAGFMSLGTCYDFDWMHFQVNP